MFQTAITEMFGVEPDLNCPSCAAGVRKRLHVRYRPLQRDRTPYVTVFCLGLSICAVVTLSVIKMARGLPAAARSEWLAVSQSSRLPLGPAIASALLLYRPLGNLGLAMMGG